ncbi:MAG: hypothetical protein M3044_03030 [Thermoproteota archaeon]|nr:hypothetical protein [Thermoproteota archaeon]
MSEDEDIVNTARLLTLDENITRRIFVAVRKYYTGKEPDVKYILNLLEASLLNAIAERKLFFNALMLALKNGPRKAENTNRNRPSIE